MAFEFEGAVTQKRTGCFERRGYGANKLLFWILPSGEVGCTENRLSFTWLFFICTSLVASKRGEKNHVKPSPWVNLGESSLGPFFPCVNGIEK